MLDLKLPAVLFVRWSVCLVFFFLSTSDFSFFLFTWPFSISLGGSGSYLNSDINRTPLITRSSGNGELEGRRGGIVHTHSQLEMGFQVSILPPPKPREKCYSFPRALMGPQASDLYKHSLQERCKNAIDCLPDSLSSGN